jgi:glutathione S-transferase
MKLYYNPRSRAVTSKWMLDECGATYEIVPIDFEKREHKTPEFLKINPAGKLPALVDGQSKVFESAAIALYLAEKFPEANLGPKVGAPERGRYLSLMVYSTSQLEPAFGDTMLGGQTSPQRGWTDFETARSIIEARAWRRSLPVRRLVYRRRCNDRFVVHLEAEFRAVRFAQAGGLCRSPAQASGGAEVRLIDNGVAPGSA